jgi:formylglycine-generating enzyme required for sulfatase activity
MASEKAFVSIPVGCFDMGSPDDEDGRFTNEGPVHNVCPKAFELGKFEVTQVQWRRVMVFINPEPSFDPRLRPEFCAPAAHGVSRHG